jgi:hypothetical protein
VSYDVNVSYKIWPGDVEERWLAELGRLGIDAQVSDDAFSLAASGWLPMRLTVRADATIPWATSFRRLGTFESGFERSRGPKKIVLTAKGAEGNACALWSAAALAAVTGGKLADPQCDVTASGKRAIDILAKLMANESFVRSFRGPETLGDLPPIGKFTVPAPDLEIVIDETKVTTEYSAASRYAVGDQVSHPTFGVGVVELSELGKVTIAFRTGRRGLAQSKASGESLARPARIDHSLPTPGSKRPTTR